MCVCLCVLCIGVCSGVCVCVCVPDSQDGSYKCVCVCVCVCFRLPGRELQGGPEQQAPEGAHGLHQGADPRAGVGVRPPQLPDPPAPLRDRRQPRPHRTTGTSRHVTHTHTRSPSTSTSPNDRYVTSRHPPEFKP